MPDILFAFPIAAGRKAVFDAVSTPAGLDQWWTQSSHGTPALGKEYELFFPPQYAWSATVTRCLPGEEFELEMSRSDTDWIRTRVGFRLASPEANETLVSFHHTGWPNANAHYRTSSYCWAMYLRILRLHLEGSMMVPYERRLLI